MVLSRGIFKMQRHVGAKSIVRIVLLAAVGAAAGIAVTVKITDWQSREGVGKSVGTAPKRLGPDNPPSVDSFQASFEKLPKRPPRESFVAVKTISAAEAVGQIEDDELVLGVEIAGVARTYPISGMSVFSHEVVNDDIGDTPVVATF